MENLTTSFSCVNMKIQQVSNIVSRVISFVLLYTQEKDVDFSFLPLHADIGQEILSTVLSSITGSD